MDYNICQAFYNPSLTIVLRQLIIGEPPKPKREGSNQLDGDFSTVKTSNLYLIKIPESFIGKKYSKLYEYLANRRSMIGLALYRKETVDLMAFEPNTENQNEKKQENKKPKSQKFKDVNYVVTNPPKYTKLNAED